MKDLIQQTSEFIIKNSLIDPGMKILLSCSAGKDSMALLAVLYALKERFRCDLGIFHLNHLMRGAESDRDEDFLKSVSDNMGLPFYVERYDFSEHKTRRGSFEEQARNVRYGLIEQYLKNRGYDRCAMAHNNDDAVETVLMRICTGTAVHGLQGIPAKRGHIIRPLLHASANDIYSFLKEKSISWREDTSNSEDTYTRNFIRNSVIPRLETRFPALRSSLNKLAAAARDHETLLRSLVNEKSYAAVNESGDCVIRLERVLDNPVLFRYVLSDAVRNADTSYVSRRVLNEIFRNAKSKRSHLVLYKNSTIYVKKTLIKKEPVLVIGTFREHPVTDDWKYDIDVADTEWGTVEIKEIGKSIQYRLVDRAEFRKYRNSSNQIFVDITDSNTVVLRNRRDGDRIRLEGGTKKIKDIIIEKKLDNESKNCVPLLIIDSQIAAFMPGLVFDIGNRVSPDFHVTEKSKKIIAFQAVNE